jgi:hypothetical protein
VKYKIAVGYAAGGDAWNEAYDDPAVSTLAQAVAKGRALVDHFNSTLRPKEKARAFLGAAIVGPSEVHQWEKSSLVTQTRGRQSFDTMKCTACRITGKRFGLGPSIVRDSIYRATKYAKCSGAPVVLKDTDE